MISPPDRASALQSLKDFLPRAPLYARDRNHVAEGHPAVSKLSAAIRHRVITEDEVVDAVLNQHRFSRVEKFIQEVRWRSYWKSWLSLRPQVWKSYLESLQMMKHTPAAKAAGAVESQDSGNEIIDHFSRELVTTGYLHNHARMWFAAWWVHLARLPWELGADFFLRHLLDADPASNTLSWRWVAGLQTPGKTYLARRSNLERYLSPSLLAGFSQALAEFENPSPHLPSDIERPTITRPILPDFPEKPDLSTGIWIHSEDLSPENSPLAECKPIAIRVIEKSAAADSQVRQTWRNAALEDAAIRAVKHWDIPVAMDVTDHIANALLRWATSHRLEQIIALRPEIGPLDDILSDIRTGLAAAGIHLALVDRPTDLAMRPLATRGFFQFWENLRVPYTS